MKNFTTITGTTTGILTVLILISGKLSSQTEILGHTYGGSLNGHSYYISDCATTWGQAQDAATQMGGYLVAITSEAENEFISEFAPLLSTNDPNISLEIHGGAWTGLVATDNNGTCGYWQWVNGETVVFTNWAIGTDEPYYTDCGSPIVIGICSNAYCVHLFQFGWFTEGYNSMVRKYIVEFNSDPGCSNSNKSYVCHNGNTICVNNDAVQAHINHGDYAGPCGPCNPSSELSQPNTHHAEIETSDGHLVEMNEDAGMHFDETIESDIIAYPNPTTGEIKIHLPNQIENFSFQILSMTGQLMDVKSLRSRNDLTLDFSDSPTGIYFLNLQAFNLSWQQKIVRL